MEYVLTTHDLSKRYGHLKALDRLSMHVPRGAVYGFVGKNGAGIYLTNPVSYTHLTLPTT